MTNNTPGELCAEHQARVPNQTSAPTTWTVISLAAEAAAARFILARQGA